MEASLGIPTCAAVLKIAPFVCVSVSWLPAICAICLPSWERIAVHLRVQEWYLLDKRLEWWETSGDQSVMTGACCAVPALLLAHFVRWPERWSTLDGCDQSNTTSSSSSVCSSTHASFALQFNDFNTSDQFKINWFHERSLSFYLTLNQHNVITNHNSITN